MKNSKLHLMELLDPAALGYAVNMAVIVRDGLIQSYDEKRRLFQMKDKVTLHEKISQPLYLYVCEAVREFNIERPMDDDPHNHLKGDEFKNKLMAATVLYSYFDFTFSGDESLAMLRLAGIFDVVNDKSDGKDTKALLRMAGAPLLGEKDAKTPTR